MTTSTATLQKILELVQSNSLNENSLNEFENSDIYNTSLLFNDECRLKVLEIATKGENPSLLACYDLAQAKLNGLWESPPEIKVAIDLFKIFINLTETEEYSIENMTNNICPNESPTSYVITPHVKTKESEHYEIYLKRTYSMFSLGLLYLDGAGMVGKSLVNAEYWLNRANENKHPHAEQILNSKIYN